MLLRFLLGACPHGSTDVRHSRTRCAAALTPFDATDFPKPSANGLSNGANNSASVTPCARATRVTGSHR
jgi:hypothetical protein